MYVIQLLLLFCFAAIIDSGYMASNNTVRVVTYNDWWTKDGVVSKTVSLIVTPKVVVSWEAENKGYYD